jgi:agmatinase
VYLSVDLDSLDVAYSPGTCVPTAGGLTNRELLWMLDIIGREVDLVSMDTVEIAPQYDSGQSSYTACQVIVDVLAAQAVRRRLGKA